jgi:hypothetical protein
VDDHLLIIAVASYASKGAAERDFGDVCGLQGRVTAGVLEKGSDGALTMDGHHATPSYPTAGGHLLGAALVVLAAPLGLRFLLSLSVTSDIWTTVANRVDHLWQNVPRSELHRMETLVEARQAALVVLSVDRTEPEVGRRLEHATACIVTEA